MFEEVRASDYGIVVGTSSSYVVVDAVLEDALQIDRKLLKRLVFVDGNVVVECFEIHRFFHIFLVVDEPVPLGVEWKRKIPGYLHVGDWGAVPSYRLDNSQRRVHPVLGRFLQDIDSSALATAAFAAAAEPSAQPAAPIPATAVATAAVAAAAEPAPKPPTAVAS